jgi:hypothetical protein
MVMSLGMRGQIKVLGWSYKKIEPPFSLFQSARGPSAIASCGRPIIFHLIVLGFRSPLFPIRRDRKYLILRRHQSLWFKFGSRWDGIYKVEAEYIVADKSSLLFCHEDPALLGRVATTTRAPSVTALFSARIPT